MNTRCSCAHNILECFVVSLVVIPWDWVWQPREVGVGHSWRAAFTIFTFLDLEEVMFFLAVSIEVTLVC